MRQNSFESRILYSPKLPHKKDFIINVFQGTHQLKIFVKHRPSLNNGSVESTLIKEEKYSEEFNGT